MATNFEVKTPDGRMEAVWKIGEFTFPERLIYSMMPAKDLDLQLKWMKETGIRDDDIIICAYPKTGKVARFFFCVCASVLKCFTTTTTLKLPSEAYLAEIL